MAAEPRTRAGQALLDAGFYLAHPAARVVDVDAARERLRRSVLAIEAEAAGEGDQSAELLRSAAWEKPE